MYITSIDQEKVREFNKWRIEKLGRIPAKATILTYNAAMNMVFKEAIGHKWIIATQVPVLTSKGESGKRRAALSEDEYEKVFDTLLNMIDNSWKEKTKLIR